MSCVTIGPAQHTALATRTYCCATPQSNTCYGAVTAVRHVDSVPYDVCGRRAPGPAECSGLHCHVSAALARYDMQCNAHCLRTLPDLGKGSWTRVASLPPLTLGSRDLAAGFPASSPEKPDMPWSLRGAQRPTGSGGLATRTGASACETKRLGGGCLGRAGERRTGDQHFSIDLQRHEHPDKTLLNG
jgi:hypothetical protein